MGYVVEGLEVDAVTSLDHFEAVKQGDATALDAPQALSEEDVIVIPYKIKGQENMIYAARKKNPKLAQLKGKTASLSDEYDVKIPPIKKHDKTFVDVSIEGISTEDAAEKAVDIIKALDEKGISAVVNNQNLRDLAEEPLQLLDFIKRYTVLDKNEDILFILGSRSDVEEGKPLMGELTPEMILALYEGIFDQGTYLSTYTKEKPLRVAIFRGGKGATGITRFLSNMANVAIDVILGATDDGRSWYIAAQDFNATGVPDVGKTLLDLGKDIDVIDFLGARLKGDKDQLVKDFTEFLEVMEEVGKGKTGEIEEKLAQYMENVEVLAKEIEGSLTKMGLNMVTDKGKRQSILSLCKLLKDPSKVYRVRAGAIRGISSLLQDVIDNAESKKEESYMQSLKDKIDRIFDFENVSGLYFYLSQMNKEKVKRLHPYLKKFMKEFRSFKKYEDPTKTTDFTLHKIPMRSIALVGAAWFYDGDWQRASNELADILDVKKEHKIMFATNERKHLMGLSEDGTIYFTESGINEHPKSSGMNIWLIDKKFDIKEFGKRLKNQGIKMKKVKVGKKEVPEEELRKEVMENTMKVDPEFAKEVAKIISEMSVTGKYAKKKVKANPEAVKALEKADVIVYGVTTIESNMGSSLIIDDLQKAIRGNKNAVKVNFTNPILENDPVVECERGGQGISALDMVEKIYRYASGQQRYFAAKPNWEKVSSFINYVVGSPALYENLDRKKTYIPFDTITMEDSTYGRIGAIGVDLEEKTPTLIEQKDYSGFKEEYGFYSPQVTGETIISLSALKKSGFKISSIKGLELISADKKEDAFRETLERFENVIDMVVKRGMKIVWFSDLEDTMNVSGKVVPDEVLETIIGILREGIPFVIVSGSSRSKIDKSFTAPLLERVGGDEKELLKNLVIASNSGNEACCYDPTINDFVLFYAVDMQKELGDSEYDMVIKIIKDAIENWKYKEKRNLKKILEDIMGMRFADDSWNRFKERFLEQRPPKGESKLITQVSLRFLGKGVERSKKEEFKKKGGDDIREKFAEYLRGELRKFNIPLRVIVTQLSTIDITLMDFDKARGVEIVSDVMKWANYYKIYSGDGFLPKHNDEAVLKIADLVINLGEYFNPVRSKYYRNKGRVFQLPDTKGKGFVEFASIFLRKIKENKKNFNREDDLPPENSATCN